MEKHTILIVDDEIEYLRSLSLLLQNKFEVLTASTGQEGLLIIKDTPISLMIVDLSLPVISGTELIAYAKKLGYNFPIIVVSGNSESVLTQVEGSPQLRILQKPVAIEDLLSTMQSLLGT